MDRLVQSANFLAAVPRLTHGGSNEKPKRVSTKMMCGLPTSRLTMRGFSGLASSNCLDSWARYGQGFHSEVAVTISPRQQNAKRFVPRAKFERFTASAMTAIMLAQEEARQLAHNSVGTEQILLGLIGEGTGTAAKVLKSMGINLKDARVEVERLIGRGIGFVAAETSFTPRAKRVLEVSLEEARQLGHHEVRTEHMLLGLLHESDGVSARLLKNLGADPSNIRKRIHVEITRDAAEKMFGRDNETVAPIIPPFTPSAKGVLENAVKEAHRLGHNYVGCEHFLLALLHEGEGEGAVAHGLEILAAHPSNKHAQVNLKDARLDVDTILGRDSGFAAPETSFAPSAKRVLELAVKEALQLGHDYIGSEHLVVALLLDGEAIADRILDILGSSCIPSNNMLLEVLREGEGVVARALELLQEGEGVVARLLKILSA